MVQFDGATYDPAKDDARLTKQIGRVYECMRDGRWRTLGEIAIATRDPEASISAQLRHLRKPKFGSYQVNRRARDGASGLHEYQIQPPIGSRTQPVFEFEKAGQGSLFQSSPWSMR